MSMASEQSQIEAAIAVFLESQPLPDPGRSNFTYFNSTTEIL